MFKNQSRKIDFILSRYLKKYSGVKVRGSFGRADWIGIMAVWLINKKGSRGQFRGNCIRAGEDFTL